MKKFDDQFLAKTDKYLPNFYIIKLQAPSSHVRCSIHTRWLLQELMDNDITIEEGEEYNNKKDIKY